MTSVNTDNGIKYPNAKTVLEEMHIAYEVENERKRTLDGKASAFMAANFAVLTIYIPLIPFDRMLYFFSKSGSYEIIVATLTLAVLVAGIILSIAAFKWLADGYSNQQYRFLNVDELLRLANAGGSYSDGTTENGMVAHYHYILRGTIDESGNMKINEDRATRIQKGINATVIGFCLINFATIAIRIIIGG